MAEVGVMNGLENTSLGSSFRSQLKIPKRASSICCFSRAEIRLKEENKLGEL